MGSVLIHAYGPPSPPLVITFFGGAVPALALAGILAFGSTKAKLGGGSERVEL